MLKYVSHLTFYFSSEIKANLKFAGVNVSETTIGRRLKERGLKACRPRKVPLHRKRHLKDRLKFCNDNKDKTLDEWDKYV